MALLLYFKLLISVLIGFTFFYGSEQIIARYDWQTASDLAVKGYYKKSIPVYENAFEALNKNADFLLDYATCLYNLKKYAQATLLLDKAKKLSNSFMVNRLLANIYFEQKKYKLAEEYYIESYFTVPNRFVSAYYLMNYYKQTDNITQAKFWARHILNMPVKINSKQVENVKRKAIIFIGENKN